MIATLCIDPAYGHAILYLSGTSHRTCHASRDKRFIFVEVALFSGRTDDVKAGLFREISNAVRRHIGVDEADILIYLVEADRNNWSGRGGIPFSKIQLGY